jgi:hypothetical protein
MNHSTKKAAATLPLVRCAIYTRKSTEEGLEQEFNSLDAQRESAQAFIRSQTHEGWTCLPERYDDGGFTGGNMERPALQRLLTDIQAGKIDLVCTYKVDRLNPRGESVRELINRAPGGFPILGIDELIRRDSPLVRSRAGFRSDGPPQRLRRNYPLHLNRGQSVSASLSRGIRIRAIGHLDNDKPRLAATILVAARPALITWVGRNPPSIKETIRFFLLE